MKTKTGISFGLALMVALGVLATALALGLFTAPKAGAEVDVTAITNTPTTPGATATFVLTFTTTTGLLSSGETISVEFDKNFTVPLIISKNNIIITTVQTTGGSSNPVIDPAVSTNASGNTVIQITIGDTVPSTNNDSEPIHPAAGHKITFSPLAGIKNPTSASLAGATSETAGAHWIRITTTDEGTQEDIDGNNSIAISRLMGRSPSFGARGTVVTITGKGFASGGTATIFLDDVGGTADGVLETSDDILGTAVIAGGEFSFTTTTDARWGTGSATLNAQDGVGVTAGTGGDASFSTQGKVVLNKTSVTRGESITVKVFQYESGVISKVTFGGVEATLLTATSSTSGVPTSGYLAMALTVPTSTPLGTQVVAVRSITENPSPTFGTRSTTIDVVGAPLTLTPSTAVPDQKITISGSGFTSGGDATVSANAISTGASTDTDSHTAVTIDNSGNLVTTYEVPGNATTTTAGSYEVLVTDSENRTGSATLVIPARVITLDPSSSRRGSTVSFEGSGYPASATVTIVYTIGTTDTTVATVSATSTGSISGTFSVPNSANIPSTNSVAGNSSTEAGTAANQSTTHKVPGASITVEPSSGTSGSQAVISGNGFPGFVSVGTLSVGGVSALPVPNPSTDVDGNFTATFLIPQLAVGSKALLATVGTGGTSVTANTSFTILATVATPTVTTQDTTVVFADDIASDNLVRVWLFSNTTKEWTFFDPRPAFATANSLTSTSSGDIVWVNFTAESTFQGTLYTSGWNQISLD